jgi:predicted signal transduction protein with EAL and GGDEF domain
MLNNADIALYQAKEMGRGTYCLFEQQMETRIKDRRALGLDLQKAIANDELFLHYQPLLNLANNKISGFEALLRWQHPLLGMIPPSDFIPIAEETGLINDIGEWVLNKSCSEAANWPDNIKIAVNVSPVQFNRNNLVEIVNDVLTKTGLPPGRLELEITESVLLHNEESTLKTLKKLHDMGVRISMDDFGTGYSSLSYLRSFPFDKIKIDASFVKDISWEDDDIGIVHAVVGLAERLGVTTTAEGVETEEQMEVLRAEGCTEAQGYFISRPLPSRDLLHFIANRSNKLKNVA